MARQKGTIKLTGTIDGLTYYESKYGLLVRRKGGPSKERVKSDPAYQRLRENGKEFGQCGKATKMLRAVLMPLLKDARDFQVTPRLIKLMSDIKNLDNASARGERRVAIGIASPGAKEVIVGFDFNAAAPLKKILRKAVTVNTGTGVISISGLVPEDHLKYTAAATHASLTGGWIRIDFGAESGELIKSNQVVLPLNGTSSNVVLTPTSGTSGIGCDIFVLQVVFYQEVNGVLYDLKSVEVNAMGVIGFA